jgi:hypothetical protein
MSLDLNQFEPINGEVLCAKFSLNLYLITTSHSSVTFVFTRAGFVLRFSTKIGLNAIFQRT